MKATRDGLEIMLFLHENKNCLKFVERQVNWNQLHSELIPKKKETE
ncbi:hypothetical protein NPIL_407121, partial [Nephila pilipes]